MLLARSIPSLRSPLLNDAAIMGGLIGTVGQRLNYSEAKDCFAFRNLKKSRDCQPVVKPKPKYFASPKPCKSDRELAAQHPKYFGAFARCKVPYKPIAECMDPCFFAVRLDDKHYSPSDSLGRKYQCHWVECHHRKPKKRCRRVPPERSYRVIAKSCSKQRTTPMCPTPTPMPCKISEPKKTTCPKIKLCNCAPTPARTDCRGPPILPPRPRCRRKATQYPSFSECKHDDIEPGRPIECRCLETPPTCIVYRQMNRNKEQNRKGPCDPPDV